MSEVIYSVIVFSTPEHGDTIELCLPLPTAYFSDVKSFEQKISSSSNAHNSKIRRYFVLLCDSPGEDTDYLYAKMEGNPQILEVFILWNESLMLSSKYTKLYYIPTELIDLIIGLRYVNYLRVEMEKTTKLNQISLSKIYLRKAEKTKDWLMANLKAEPCHVLVIPLNSNTDNLNRSIKRIQEICVKLGYPRSVVRSLDEYIPKGEFYNKFPYGKLIFEYEDPQLVCRWLRTLGSIRLYLYGNEPTIPKEWSKQMIIHEPDPAAKQILNDEDLCSFLENDSIKDDIKWNFFTRHAQTWQIQQLTPLKIESLNDNIRFRSALRRAHINYFDRMTSITSQVYDWYDECRAQGHIAREFVLLRRDKPTGSISRSKRLDDESLTPQIENSNYTITVSEKDAYAYTVSYTPSQMNEMITYQAGKAKEVFLWLDSDLFDIDPRFQSLVYPEKWHYLSDVEQCQQYILNEQMQSDSRIYLIAPYILAEQLFNYEHVSKVWAVYLYASSSGFRPGWIKNFPRIRDIYEDRSVLFEQLETDLTTKREISPAEDQAQELVIPDLLPLTFLDSHPESFRFSRSLIKGLAESFDQSEAKQAMTDALREKFNGTESIAERIANFEANYHSDAAIQWYTKDSFLCFLINRTLREGNIEFIIILRFIILDLYRKLDELHQQMLSSDSFREQSMLTFYRGQKLSSTEIERLEQSIGRFVCSKTFLSTTASLDVALMFAGQEVDGSTTFDKQVIFCIEVNPAIQNTRPYAMIDVFSTFEPEEEVLFAPGTVFRIEKIDFSTGSDDIPVIHLKLIDEDDIPKESTSPNLLQIFPKQKSTFPSDRNYVIVGLADAFKSKEHYDQIKGRLEDASVQFFDNINDLNDYTKSLSTMESFVIFLHTCLQLPERYQHCKIISFSEEDMHWNDLIYQLLYEMEHDNREKDSMKNLYGNIADIYRSRSVDKTGFVYVQLLQSSSAVLSDGEEQLRSRLPSSASLVTFYQTEPCINFLQSLIEPEKIGNVRLIIQSDQTNLEKLLNQFEPIQSIKFIYLCSANAFDTPSRRIIHGQFLNLHDLYLQLHTDHLYESFRQANQQIELYQSKTEGKKFLEETDYFLNRIKEEK